MTPDTILVSRSPGETRAALMAGDEIIEIAHCRDADIQSGAVYLGRAGASVPGIDAVFVDIGAADAGVLAMKPPFPTEGASLPVVVVVPPRADKGCALRLEPDAGLADNAKGPRLLKPAPHPAQSWWVRCRASIERILCEPLTEATHVQALLDAKTPVEATAVHEDLFSLNSVDEAIELALSPIVPLPSGGSIIIETTSAVTAIDVNSGAAKPATANGEAITAVAKELRRRNIAGHIVIDVIPGKNNGALPRLLAKAMNEDPVPSRVAGFTPLGMIELTRQRSGLSLAETLLDNHGQLSAKSVALQALRDAVREAIAVRTANIALSVAPDVHALLQGGLLPAMEEACNQIKGNIKLVSRPEFSRARVEVKAA